MSNREEIIFQNELLKKINESYEREADLLRLAIKTQGEIIDAHDNYQKSALQLRVIHLVQNANAIKQQREALCRA